MDINIKYEKESNISLNVNEIKKDLYKNKSFAIFQSYELGNLWYRITTANIIIDIPITITNVSEIGSTIFEREIKASLLNRWIEISILNHTYRLISYTHADTNN